MGMPVDKSGEKIRSFKVNHPVTQCVVPYTGYLAAKYSHICRFYFSIKYVYYSGI
ncbi:MAG: hypothetical protein JMHAAFGB_00271 [Dehalococcoides mccartyi]|nr:hypothetical protein [Dehalococcoides mccartyi]MEA2122144.1 hypothetical protein [Dehalococcoides mccartyi]